MLRVPLGVWPTAVQRADRLSSVLGGSGGDLWIKRDDLSGFSWGGNKVRTVEFLLAAAKAQEATDIVLAGGPSSNFAALMAAGARVCGLGVHQVSYGEEPDHDVAALSVGRSLGTKVVFTGSTDRSEMEVVAERYAADLLAKGARPYVVPRGGATAIGALGFFLAGEEIEAQTTDDQPVTIILPLGSGGSTAGLLAGLCLSQRPWRVHAISVSRDPASIQGAIVEKAIRSAELRGVSLAAEQITDRLLIHDGRDPGFGKVSKEQQELMSEITSATGLLVDPTYNAKALWWLSNQRREGRFADLPLLYWHTGGALGVIDHIRSLERTQPK